MSEKALKWIYLGNRFFSSPLESLFSLLIFLLSNEMNINPVQLTLLAAAKPLSSLVAFYINAVICPKCSQLRYYLLVLNAVGSLPCLLFPIIDRASYFIVSYYLFMIALRASYPAWMEILRIHAERKEPGNLVSKGTSVNYLMIMFLPVILSGLLDQHGGIWKSLFLIFGLMQLLNMALLFRLNPIHFQTISISSFNIRSILLNPWKVAWQLCIDNKQFAHYLIVFFIGGAGLVALQPILPIYFKDVLKLSYFELTLAMSLIKGFFFLVSSHYWLRWKNNLYGLNALMNLFSCLFIVCLLASITNTAWVFAAYVAYGIMQAGCELSFNLSGPHFANYGSSLSHSGVNLALIGIRGCLFPFFGQLLFFYTNSYAVLITCIGLCIVAALYAFYLEQRYKPVEEHNHVTV